MQSNGHVAVWRAGRAKPPKAANEDMSPHVVMDAYLKAAGDHAGSSGAGARRQLSAAPLAALG